MTKKALMKEIMHTDFALKEVILFLDTHPRCPKALGYYHEMKKRNKMLTEEYEKQFGPLTAKCNESENSWDWVNSPWPWQADTCLADSHLRDNGLSDRYPTAKSPCGNGGNVNVAI